MYYDAITPGEKDFKVPLTKLRETKPDVWYFTGYYAEAALLVSQARQIGIKAPFVGGNAAINDEFVKIAGVQVAKGCYMTNEPLPAGPAVRRGQGVPRGLQGQVRRHPLEPLADLRRRRREHHRLRHRQDRVDRLDQARRLPARHGRRRAGHHRQDRVHGQGRPRRRALLPVHRRRSGQDRRVEVALATAGGGAPRRRRSRRCASLSSSWSTASLSGHSSD